MLNNYVNILPEVSLHTYKSQHDFLTEIIIVDRTVENKQSENEKRTSYFKNCLKRKENGRGKGSAFPFLLVLTDMCSCFLKEVSLFSSWKRSHLN